METAPGAIEVATAVAVATADKNSEDLGNSRHGTTPGAMEVRRQELRGPQE
jgi:hypothetical protein